MAGKGADNAVKPTSAIAGLTGGWVATTMAAVSAADRPVPSRVFTSFPPITRTPGGYSKAYQHGPSGRSAALPLAASVALEV